MLARCLLLVILTKGRARGSHVRPRYRDATQPPTPRPRPRASTSHLLVLTNPSCLRHFLSLRAGGWAPRPGLWGHLRPRPLDRPKEAEEENSEYGYSTAPVQLIECFLQPHFIITTTNISLSPPPSSSSFSLSYFFFSIFSLPFGVCRLVMCSCALSIASSFAKHTRVAGKIILVTSLLSFNQIALKKKGTHNVVLQNYTSSTSHDDADDDDDDVFRALRAKISYPTACLPSFSSVAGSATSISTTHHLSC